MKNKEKIVEYFILILIGFVFVASHYMAINSVDEPAGFYPPYIEKKIIYPELYQKKSDYNFKKYKSNNV